MMKHHRPGRLRLIGGISAVALLAAASLATGNGAAAAPAAVSPPAQTLVPQNAEGGFVQGQERNRDGSMRPSVRVVAMLGDSAAPAAAPAAGKEPEVKIRRFRLEKAEKGGVAPQPGTGGPSADELAGLTAKCDPAERTELDAGDERNRTRIVLCTKGDRAPADRADKLQQARDRLAQDSEIKDEHRDRMLAALDKEIARLRGQ